MEDKYIKIERLVQAAKNNNKDSILELYYIFLPYVKMWYSKVTLKEHTFEDILQEYFIWLNTAISKYNGTCTFTSYITKTIKNNLFMLIRKKYLETSTDLTFLIQDNTCLEDLILNKIEIHDMIEKSSKLTDIEKKVLKDYYFNDLTLYCISSKINKKYSTTAKIKSKALVKLYESAAKDKL